MFVAVAETAGSGSAVTWPVVVLALITTVFVPLVGLLVAWGQAKTRRVIVQGQTDIKEQVGRVQKKTDLVSTKVTSNHGNDNLGDKVDEMLDSVRALAVSVEENKNATNEQYGLFDRFITHFGSFETRLRKIEAVTHEAASQVGEHAAVAQGNVADLTERLEHLGEDHPIPATFPATSTKVCRRTDCTGCSYRHLPKK